MVTNKKTWIRWILILGALIAFVAFAVRPGLQWIDEVQSTISINNMEIDSLKVANRRYKDSINILKSREKELVKALERSIDKVEETSLAFYKYKEALAKKEPSVTITSEDSLILEKLKGIR